MNHKPALAWFSVASTRTFLYAALSVLAATTSGGEPSHSQALLIGIEDYVIADKLPGVMNDVESLNDVLKYRGGYQVDVVINSAKVDRDAATGDFSEAEWLQQRIEGWLRQRNQSQSVILYFSGHGFRDEENHLYLAAKDCDPQDPKPGGIPIAWLRDELVACSASSKLLILDACHGGNARSAKSKGAVNAKELQDFFEQTEGLVTLAACTGDQQSYLWPAKKQSIFTYWLVQGLCGNADGEPLGEITINELDDYLWKRVSRTALALSGLDQTPTRLQGPDASQHVLLRLQPVTLKTLLDDLAEQLDVEMCPGERKQDDRLWVGVVPEFADDVTGTQVGRRYGALATQCPVELANRLAVKSDGAYHVLNTNAVRELLQSRGVTGKDIGTEKSREMAVGERRLTYLIVGQLTSLKDNSIAVQCKVLNLADGEMFGLASGTARLCASEVAMQGTSGRLTPNTPAAAASDQATPTDGREIAQLTHSASHPLQDASFEFQARILVKGNDGQFRERAATYIEKKEKKGLDAEASERPDQPQQAQTECFVQLNRSEVFQIRYRSDKRVFAKVLVDGLNTLPERSQSKGIEVEAALRKQYLQAQPVNLAEARAWGPLIPDKEYAVAGFYLKTGTAGAYDEFKVVDAAQSLAADAGFTDQLGLITLAFYEPQKKPPPPPPRPPGTRSMVGVARGDRYQKKTDTYSGDEEPGRLLAVIHIRYGQ